MGVWAARREGARAEPQPAAGGGHTIKPEGGGGRWEAGGRPPRSALVPFDRSRMCIKKKEATVSQKTITTMHA